MLKVSVVVPVYNCEKYIEQCVDSLISQSYSDIEVLLIDDGCSDGSGQICDAFAQKDPRVKVIHKKNEGVSVARNTGIEQSNGAWVLFVDSDDWLPKKGISRILDFCVENDLDIGIGNFYTENILNKKVDSFFNATVIDGHIFQNAEKILLLKNCINIAELGNMSSGANLGVPWAKIYRRDFLIKNKLFYQPGLKRMQDCIFNLYAFEASNKIGYKKEYIYHYRKLDSSVTHKYDPNFDQTAKQVIEAIERFIRTTSHDDLMDEYFTKAAKLFIEWIRLSIAPNTDSYLQKRKKIIEQNYMEPFTNSQNKCDLKKMYSSQKIGIFLWKYRMWDLLLWFYMGIHKQKQKSLYKS